MYHVKILLNDNHSLSANYENLNKTVKTVGDLLALDVNEEIKRIEIEPEWKGEKICKPVETKTIDKKTGKEI